MNKNKILQNKINKKLTHLTNKKKCNFFGRANSAIWCIGEFLKKNSTKRTILLPSTMCVSPIIIFKILGFKLEFVDVNKSNGLLNVEEVIKKTNKKNHDILSIFYVNLFGNKDKKARKLKKIKDVLIIQDLAQTFICKENIKKDLFGNLIIFSFGYSKIFDLNHGGIVMSNNTAFHDFGVNFNENIKNTNISSVGKNKYLKWYNNAVTKKKKFNFTELKTFAYNIYLIKFDSRKLIKMNKSLNILSKEFKRRMFLFNIYKKKIKESNLDIIHSEDVFTPWRFSILMNQKNSYLTKIRKKGIDASSYYPNIGRIFSIKKYKETYINSDLLEKKIINFWLTKEYNQNKIYKTCNILNEK